jgi:hypothetical protein
MENRTPELIPQELGDDLLRGADEIAQFIFGRTGKNRRRAVYYLCRTSRLPHFRLGSMICARKSTLIGYISAQERRADYGNSPREDTQRSGAEQR